MPLEDGKITRMGPDITEPVDEIIDASEHWVIPGFVDTHTTLWQSKHAGADRRLVAR